MESNFNQSMSKQERIISMDIMRGFAIFGIFLVNMLSFHSPLLYIDPIEWWNGSLDKGTYMTIDILAQGSFYPLFSLLFGYGLVLLRESNLARGVTFTPIALRRLFLLLLIGCVHAFFVWHGDILINYAILGLIFLLFIRLSGKALMITGTLMYIIPNIILFLLFIVMVMFVPEGELSPYNQVEANASIEAYQLGSFMEVTEQRYKDWYFVNNLGNSFLMLFMILPLFLLGGGAAKLKWLQRVQQNKKKFKIMFMITLIVGLIFKISPYLIVKNFATEYLQDIFGGPLLAIAFALGIALLVESTKGMSKLKIFAPVGKLAISNYLLQSIVSTFIFYSYGLGLYGEISAFTGSLLVIGIFIIQVVISHYWVKRFAYGPVEWMWRSFTYMKIQKWRKL